MFANSLLRAIAVIAAISFSSSVSADTAQNLVGTWKLKRWILEDVESRAQKPSPFGERPSGFVILTASNRLIALITAENRTVPEGADASVANFKTMYAYSGLYRIEGADFITKVDIAGEPKWIGSEQKRGYRFENENLIIESPATTQDGKSWRGILEWERQR